MTIFTARLVVGAFGTVALLTVTQGAIAKEAAIILGQGTASCGTWAAERRSKSARALAYEA
jgi:hypothetical protein